MPPTFSLINLEKAEISHEAKNVYNLKIKRYRRSKDTFEDENMFLLVRVLKAYIIFTPTFLPLPKLATHILVHFEGLSVIFQSAYKAPHTQRDTFRVHSYPKTTNLNTVICQKYSETSNLPYKFHIKYIFLN